MLNREEIKRYNRHIILAEVGPEGQEKLKAANVLVIGAGGLGCPVLQYLTAAGVGCIGIVDNDMVSESNLQRQILFNHDDIGKSKAITATERLKKQNPFIKFNIYNERLTKENAISIISEYDIIVDGSDNIPTRLLVNDSCVILNKPLVYGAIYKFSGQASVFNYNKGPTYRCLFPEMPAEQEIPDCSTIGVIGVIPGIIGSIQAIETIKIILEKGDVLSGRLFQIDTLNFNIDLINLERDEKAAYIKELGDYGDPYCSVDENIEINNITAKELKNLIDKKADIEIIDVRQKSLFENYNIGGKNIEMEKLLFEVDLIPKNKKVVILCEIGEKSLALTEYFQIKKNLDNVYNLKEGIQAWIDQGYKLQRADN
ncbi:molybdopterin-synthase adenylyltransferase MoeB [Bacteroidota bacterium]